MARLKNKRENTGDLKIEKHDQRPAETMVFGDVYTLLLKVKNVRNSNKQAGHHTNLKALYFGTITY